MTVLKVFSVPDSQFPEVDEIPAEKYPEIDCPVCNRKMQEGTGGMWLHYIEFKCDYIAEIQRLKAEDGIVDSIFHALTHPEAWEQSKRAYRHQMVPRAEHFNPRAVEPFHTVQDDVVVRYQGRLDWVDPPYPPWVMIQKLLEHRNAVRRGPRK